MCFEHSNFKWSLSQVSINFFIGTIIVSSFFKLVSVDKYHNSLEYCGNMINFRPLSDIICCDSIPLQYLAFWLAIL